MMRDGVREQLTGALNCVSFDEVLRTEFVQAQDRGHPVAIVLLDIDDFTSINARWGSGVGNRVILTLSEQIAASLRAEDRLARCGNDAFAILCTDASPGYPSVLAYRLRTRISLLPCEIAEANDSLFFTVSIGIATFPAPAIRAADDLWTAAEGALLQARTAGGNHVCIAE